MDTKTGVKKQHILSRRERIKRNPFAWIILLILTLVFLGTVVFPRFSEWETKKQEIVLLQNQINTLKLENSKKRKLTEEKELEFNLISAPYLTEEKQIFPKKINIDKMVKILELYALQLENLDTKQYNSHFQLEKVSFGDPKAAKGRPYSETSVSLAFLCDQRNLKEFIEFLQTGNLSDRFKLGKDQGQIQLVDYKFLQDNLLPLVQIDSIKSSFSKEKSKNSDVLSVQIKARFLSQ